MTPKGVEQIEIGSGDYVAVYVTPTMTPKGVEQVMRVYSHLRDHRDADDDAERR